MSDHDLPPDDVVLAYIRGELGPDATHSLEQRLRNESELRRQLRLLQDMAGVAFVQHFDAHEDGIFGQLQQRVEAATSRCASSTASGCRHALLVWMRRHALILQGGLAVLVVAQAVTLSMVLPRRPTTPSTPAAPPAVMVRGTGESCLTVIVQFRPDIGVQQVTQWLDQYGASIQAGPTGNGNYRIAAKSKSVLRAMLADPNARALIATRHESIACNR